MFGQYKRIRGLYEGVLTGKGLTYGGSLARTEATGYGLLYLTQELMKDHGETMEGKTVVVSGAGNVAIYAIQKAHQMGAKVPLWISCRIPAARRSWLHISWHYRFYLRRYSLS